MCKNYFDSKLDLKKSVVLERLFEIAGSHVRFYKKYSITMKMDIISSNIHLEHVVYVLISWCPALSYFADCVKKDVGGKKVCFENFAL